MPPRARNRLTQRQFFCLLCSMYWPSTPATKISPVVHLNILKVSCFMMEVAKMRPNSQNGEEWSLTHQKGGIWVDFFAIFVFLCLRMASHLVGKCLKFNKISCRTFWYAILTTRWLWEVSVVKKSSKISEMAKNEWIFFAIFCFCASEWPHTWLESVSNLIKFYAEHFGMPYLPPGGSGRS